MPPKGTPERSADSVAFMLTQVGARAAQDFAKSLAPLGLTPPDAGILGLLSRLPGLSQQELADRLGMHASRLVAVIDSMEERGLVVRQANANDRRIYALQLSEAGREALNKIGRASRAHDEAFCDGLSASEHSQLGELLKKLANRHGLAPGIHPGYRTLGKPSEAKHPAVPQEKK